VSRVGVLADLAVKPKLKDKGGKMEWRRETRDEGRGTRDDAVIGEVELLTGMKEKN